MKTLSSVKCVLFGHSLVTTFVDDAPYWCWNKASSYEVKCETCGQPAHAIFSFYDVLLKRSQRNDPRFSDRIDICETKLSGSVEATSAALTQDFQNDNFTSRLIKLLSSP